VELAKVKEEIETQIT